MAKKRRSRRSGFFAKAKRGFSRRSSGGGDVGMLLLGSALYGALREKLSTAIAPVTSKLPAGELADELGMGLLSYFAYKKLHNPTMKAVAKAGLTIEAARVGEYVMQKGITGIGSSSESSFA